MFQDDFKGYSDKLQNLSREFVKAYNTPTKNMKLLSRISNEAKGCLKELISSLRSAISDTQTKLDFNISCFYNDSIGKNSSHTEWMNFQSNPKLEDQLSFNRVANIIIHANLPDGFWIDTNQNHYLYYVNRTRENKTTDEFLVLDVYKLCDEIKRNV